MVRPRSIGLLLLALGIAVGFALLGQWQLDRAVQSGTVVQRTTERPVPLETIAAPQQLMTQASTGQLVTVTATFVPADYAVVENRWNRGERGYWVVGNARVQSAGGPATLAVALGWSADAASADAARLTLQRESGGNSASLLGRYLPSEAPTVPSKGAPAQSMSTMSVAALINRWTDVQPVYAGYLTASTAPAGLTAIDSPAPQQQVELNFLNLFYAAEWTLFAAIALAIWYRMMRDVYEREREDESVLVEAGNGRPRIEP